ncbi:MAG TPA: histidine kinase [Gaiellaceae bacterium]|nr:histidine kinase [Gaiellaceae bacterium]
MSLFWRVFATNASVLVGAAVVLAATPLAVEVPQTAVEGAVGVASLLVVLAVNLLLLRPHFEPLARLARLMQRVDALQPGQRVEVHGRGEVALLVETFNEMLERLESERRQAMARVLTAQEEERHRIARNLHDEIGQALTGALLQLERVGRDVPAAVRGEVAEAQEAVRESLDEVRRVARELRPVALEDLGLASALVALARSFSQRTGLPVRRRIATSLPPLSEEAEVVVYRVAQESLTNIARHSGADSAELRLERVPGGVILRVADDGCGIDPADLRSAGGVRGMREWALLAGGRLEIRNGSPRGVQVSLRVGALDERRPQAAAAEAPAATGRGPRPAARGVPAT